MDLSDFDFSLKIPPYKIPFVQASAEVGILSMLMAINLQLSELISVAAKKDAEQVSKAYLEFASKVSEELHAAILAKFAK